MMIDSKIELTHVLIPKQKGTHDSCVTTNEEQILEFQGMSFFAAWKTAIFLEFRELNLILEYSGVS